MWAAIGLALSLLVTVIASRTALAGTQNAYALHEYSMTRRSHKNYALVSLLFSGTFVAALIVPAVPAVPLLAFYALIAILYFASFARGFSDEER